MGVGARVLGTVVLGASALTGCVGSGDEGAPPKPLGADAPELAAGLPPRSAVRPAHRVRVLPPLGQRPRGSRRVEVLIGDRLRNMRPTVVAFLPRGWRVDRSPRDPSTPPAAEVPQRLANGKDAELAFRGHGHTILVAACEYTSPGAGSGRESGLDDPTGEIAARVVADGRPSFPPAMRTSAPPRIAARVYRSGGVVVVGFPGGGCLFLGDPAFADMPTRNLSPGQARALYHRLERRPAKVLLAIAKRTSGYWGRRNSEPASNMRAEAIARRTQRAALSAQRLAYKDRRGSCRDETACRTVRWETTRAVERDRTRDYAIAEVSGLSRATPLLIVRRGDDVRYSETAPCWLPEPSPGFLSTSSDVFAIPGPWSGDERAALFPPLHRAQLSYEPPRRAAQGRTRLYWTSYSDRGTALVDNATLRLLSVDRIQASTLNQERRKVSFSYPFQVEHTRPAPRCR